MKEKAQIKDVKDNLCINYDENFYRPYWEVEGWVEEGWRPMGRIREEEARRQESQWRASKTFEEQYQEQVHV